MTRIVRAAAGGFFLALSAWHGGAGRALALDPAADVEGWSPPLTDAFGPVRGPRVLRHLDLGFVAHLRYSHEPTPALRVPLHEGGSDLGTPIVARLGARVGAAIGFFDRLELDVVLPFVLVQASEPFSHPQARAAMPLPDGAGLGDLALRLQGLAFDDESVSLALALDATIPTGRKEILAGERSVAFTPGVIAALRSSPVEVVLGAGARLRAMPALLPDARQLGHELLGALAARFTLATDLVAGLSLEGRLPFDAFEQRHAASVEASLFLAGTLRGPDAFVQIEASGGTALPRVYGAPSGRAALAARFLVDLGVRDEDDDGVPDRSDRCPDARETRNGVEDDDGCPEPDEDGDGVPDVRDACPRHAQDAEGRGGCPADRIDDDRDGVPDVRDACLDAPEDTNGVDDEDGCPDGGRGSENAGDSGEFDESDAGG